MKKSILFIFGTRPEAIKLAPLIIGFQNTTKDVDINICVTGQHRKLLDQVLEFFNINPDYDLDLMTQNQNLFEITGKMLSRLEGILTNSKTDLIIVQGDTTTAFIGALAGYYSGIKVAHIEAGLRSGNKYKPYPEEINRIMISNLTDYHFAPTEASKTNLLNEGIIENVWVVGNTVIDSLIFTLNEIRNNGDEKYYDYFNFIDFSKKIVVVTGHRREHFGKIFKGICEALRNIAEENPGIEIIYPAHLNPNVQKTTKALLSDVDNIHLISPLEYSYMVWLLNKSYIILTDSGGIQEEAPSLGKPVLVMRDVTERNEGICVGTAKLVGTDKSSITSGIRTLLNNSNEYKKMARAVNPYGDGESSNRIIKILTNIFH